MWKSLITGFAAPALLVVPAPAVERYGPTGMATYEIFVATNRIRAEAGCAPLRADTELIIASVRQSSYMAVTRTFSHVGPGGSTFVTRANAAGYSQPLGENIAWGYQNPSEVITAWMASPPHRANILNCAATSVGGGTRLASDGTPYYTQVFG